MATNISFEDVLHSVNAQNFEDIAFKVFKFQLENNQLYRDFATRIGRSDPSSLHDIPFLPISFFKTHDIQSGLWKAQTTFVSSGTGGSVSRHLVKDLDAYVQHCERIFLEFFGPLTEYHFVALLPSYLERGGSSLVAMADYFIRKSNSPYSGFYLKNQEDLVDKLQSLKTSDRKVMLLGVTFALLQLAEDNSVDLRHCMVMETGGMKGRKPEITREELHRVLGSRLNVSPVCSEYGMTELLSQAYSRADGKFRTPSCMHVLIRDLNDPFAIGGSTGGINIIDLANLDTCSFIETQDLGKINQDGSFEVLGRIDNSDVRGCNLLVE